MSEVSDSRPPELPLDDVPVGAAADSGPDRAGSSDTEGPPAAGGPDSVVALLASIREAQGDDGSEGGGRRSERGVWIRAFIYVIGFHMFAGFVIILFYFGNRNH